MKKTLGNEQLEPLIFTIADIALCLMQIWHASMA